MDPDWGSRSKLSDPTDWRPTETIFDRTEDQGKKRGGVIEPNETFWYATGTRVGQFPVSSETGIFKVFILYITRYVQNSDSLGPLRLWTYCFREYPERKSVVNYVVLIELQSVAGRLRQKGRQSLLGHRTRWTLWTGVGRVHHSVERPR